MVYNDWGIGMKSRAVTLAAVIGAYFATASIAQVNESVHEASFSYNGQDKVIAQADRIDGAKVAALYRLPADCEGICIAPMTEIAGVKTIAEPDVIAFMADQVATGRGLIIDSRPPAERLAGYLPTSVNVPARLISPDNPLLDDILLALGATVQDGTFTFETAMPLLVYDAGPMKSDATALINSLIKQGYPDNAIRYYRGGMLVWTALGLTTEGTTE